MPRIRALVLLGLFLVNQAACTSWQVPKVTPQEYAAQHPDSTVTGAIDGQPTYEQRSDRMKMRITPKDEQGNPEDKVVLTGVRFSEDSVFGRDPRGQPIASSLRHVATFEVRGAAPGRTAFLLVACVGLIAAGVASVAAGLNGISQLHISGPLLSP